MTELQEYQMRGRDIAARMEEIDHGNPDQWDEFVTSLDAAMGMMAEMRAFALACKAKGFTIADIGMK